MTDAVITVDQIVCSWLFARGKTIHTYLKALKHAADGVRELKFSSMPLVQHAILKRVPGKPWFELPVGFTDYTRVAVRIGDSWRPVAVARQLIAGAQYAGSDLSGVDLGDDLNSGPADGSWYGQQGTEGVGMSGNDFGATDFNSDDASGSSVDFGKGFGNDWNRKDAVAFDLAHGRLMCYEAFPYDEIYLIYVAVGTVDSMTGIPANAQAVIEAFMDWKYAAMKRNNRAEAEGNKQEFKEQHNIYRARRYHWNVTDLKRVFEKRDIGTGLVGYDCYSGGCINYNNNDSSGGITPDDTTPYIFESQFEETFE